MSASNPKIKSSFIVNPLFAIGMIALAFLLSPATRAAVVLFMPSEPISSGDLTDVGIRYLEWDVVGEEASAYLNPSGIPQMGGTTHVALSVSWGLSASPLMLGSNSQFFGQGDSWSFNLNLPADIVIGPDSTLNSSNSFSAAGGSFEVGESGFLGYKFDLVDGTHYGYANVTFLGAGIGYQLNYWAYESVANVGIATGAQPTNVPEPETLAALLGCAAFVWGWFRRHKD